jgi:hypothetical protein
VSPRTAGRRKRSATQCGTPVIIKYIELSSQPRLSPTRSAARRVGSVFVMRTPTPSTRRETAAKAMIRISAAKRRHRCVFHCSDHLCSHHMIRAVSGKLWAVCRLEYEDHNAANDEPLSVAWIDVASRMAHVIAAS